MYKIIGADWKEYGPVSADTIRQWIKENRATADTRVQLEGSRQWQRLAELAEFAPDFPAVPTGSLSSASVPSPAAPISAGPSSFSPQPRVQGLAIAGLIMSILGFFQCCAPLLCTLGLILSAMALVQIRQHPQYYTGKDLAIAGIVFAVAGFFLSLILQWSGVTKQMENLLRDLLS